MKSGIPLDLTTKQVLDSMEAFGRENENAPEPDPLFILFYHEVLHDKEHPANVAGLGNTITALAPDCHPTCRIAYAMSVGFSFGVRVAIDRLTKEAADAN